MKKMTLMLLMAVVSAVAFAQVPATQPSVGVMGQKLFTLPTAARLAQVAKADASTDVVTEQPAGNLKQYTRLGGANKLNSTGNGVDYLAQSGYAYIVFATDGSLDVWLKDPICWFNTGAWVKGKLSADKKVITVPTGQNLSRNSQGLNIRMEKADVAGSGIVYNSANTEVTYTIDDNVIHLQDCDGENHVLAAMWSDDHSWQGYCDWSTAYIDEDYDPTNPEDPTNPAQTVSVPTGLETETYVYMGFDLSFDSDGKVSEQELFQTDALVGFVGDKVYIQGLSPYLREAWVEGTVSGSTVTISQGQYLGLYTYNATDYPFYIVGADAETEAIGDLVFNYDSEAGTLELKDGTWMVENGNATTISETVYGVYSGLFLMKPSTDGIESVKTSGATSANQHVVFDLQGRKVAVGATTSLPKGIYIQNGKKLLVR